MSRLVVECLEALRRPVHTGLKRRTLVSDENVYAAFRFSEHRRQRWRPLAISLVHGRADSPHWTPYGCKSPGDLERDLIHLKTRFRVMSHEELVAHRENGRRVPPNAATLSFDDGFVECFTVAKPLLLAHGLPATFFICSSFVDNRELMYRNKVALCLSRIGMATAAEISGFQTRLRAQFGLTFATPLEIGKWLLGLDFAHRDIIDAACVRLGIDVEAFLRDQRPYMTRSQIAQLHSDGFTIGSHTSDHPQLGKLPDWEEVRRQARESCDFARGITGRARVPLAFPFNGRNLPRGRLAALPVRSASTSCTTRTV